VTIRTTKKSAAMIDVARRASSLGQSSPVESRCAIGVS